MQCPKCGHEVEGDFCSYCGGKFKKPKRNFISKLPGFRSGVWWKKIIASIFYFFALLTLIAIFIPGLGVEGLIEDAKEYASEGQYALALSSYRQALEKWESDTSYSVTKDEIEKEVEKLKTAYAEQLVNEANQEFKSGNIDKAEELLTQARNHDPSLQAIAALTKEIDQIRAKEKADILLDEALAAFDKNEIDKAIEKLNSASLLAKDYPRLEEIRNNFSATLRVKANEYINAAEQAFEDWDISTAKVSIYSAENLVPDHEKLEGLKNKLKDAEAVIAEIGPKPKNSAWDAAVAPVVDFLKANLKDPDSVQYAEWSPVTLLTIGGKNYWAVRCKYRAKNSFGGYVLSNQIFYIRNGQVVDYTDF